MDAVASYFPSHSVQDIKSKLLSFTSIAAFQSDLVCEVVDRIIGASVDQFFFEGLEHVDQHSSHLFMSNHRDIVLDSAFLNYVLNKSGYNTSEIAIGSNLLHVPWVKDLVRLNKTFIVKRGVPKDQFLATSKNLSAYIAHTLTERKESIWIAQREGRAKDGFDKTNPGLLKMLTMGVETNDLLDYLIAMNILPVALSYEYDPCDAMKLPELIAKAKGAAYVKTSDEDLKHMATGIKEYKGNVKVNFGAAISEELKQLSGIKKRNELLQSVAAIIDNSIYKNYHLWPTNYLAHDLLHDSDVFSNKYNDHQKEKFNSYMASKLSDFSRDIMAKELWLTMYANPVVNQLKVLDQSQD